MMNSITGLDGTQELLIKLLEQNPDDWGMRKKVVWFLYEAGYFREASKVVWNAPEIPPVDKEVVFAARIVSKGQPTRAMRLLNAVIERNRNEPEQNLAMAKELVRGGMPLQAVRFYGAATLSDASLLDEDFEISMLTADAEEEDWSEVVQTEDFPWEGPIELTEMNFLSEEDAGDGADDDDMLSGLTQPVPLKAPVQSMKDTVKEDEKAVDLRVPQKPRPLNPDKISTEAVTLSVQKDQEEEKLEKSDSDVDVNESSEKEAAAQDVVEKTAKIEAKLDEDEKTEASAKEEEESLPVIEHLKDHTAAVAERVDEDALESKQEEPQEDDESTPEDEVETAPEAEDESEVTAEEPEEAPVAAKKGVFSSLMGLFRRSKGRKAADQSDADILSAPEPAPEAKTASVMMKPAQPVVAAPVAAPVAGPIKPKPVPVPSELQGGGGRRFGQPEALDCRTRLVALAPEDGTAFFTELKEKYGAEADASALTQVVLAREEGDLDYLDLIEKACSNDKSVNLDAFTQLLGLHAVMTEANCDAWVEDMNILRQGFGDAVLATVVSKYSVGECREILGAVYRRTATQAAI